jgi:hypothetical protein
VTSFTGRVLSGHTPAVEDDPREPTEGGLTAEESAALKGEPSIDVQDEADDEPVNRTPHQPADPQEREEREEAPGDDVAKVPLGVNGRNPEPKLGKRVNSFCLRVMRSLAGLRQIGEWTELAPKVAPDIRPKIIEALNTLIGDLACLRQELVTCREPDAATTIIPVGDAPHVEEPPPTTPHAPRDVTITTGECLRPLTFMTLTQLTSLVNQVALATDNEWRRRRQQLRNNPALFLETVTTESTDYLESLVADSRAGGSDAELWAKEIQRMAREEIARRKNLDQTGIQSDDTMMSAQGE